MRLLLTLIFLLALHNACAAGGNQAVLHQRCVAAIAASGQPANHEGAEGNHHPDGRERLHVPVRRQRRRHVHLPDLRRRQSGRARLRFDRPGAQLSAQGRRTQKLPAELDKKCTYFLQKEIKPRDEALYIDHAIVNRIHVTPNHSDKSWVYTWNWTAIRIAA